MNAPQPRLSGPDRPDRFVPSEEGMAKALAILAPAENKRMRDLSRCTHEKRSARVSQTTIEAVRQWISANPGKSTRQIADGLGLTQKSALDAARSLWENGEAIRYKREKILRYEVAE